MTFRLLCWSDGLYRVMAGGIVISEPFATNAEAWDWLDQRELPLSRRKRPKRVVVDREQVRNLAPVILKTAKLNRYDKRFVSGFLKQANRAITDMLVTEAEAGQWSRIKENCA